jgi:GTPase SAR1 family protein
MAFRQSQEPYDIPDDDIRSAATRIISAYESGHFQKYAKEQHFLMIGRSGTGKSSLAGVLINGESDEGSFGAHAGTTELVLTTEVTKNNTKYFVHDTRGLGDTRVNLDDMKDAVKRVYDNNDCLVIVCIRWDDRFTDWNSKLALEVCNSLGDDVWNKAVIAITHSDILPGRVKRDSSLKAQFIKDKKSEWISTIRDELRRHGVSENTTRAVQICFTSHTDEDCEAEPGWRQKLGEGLLTTAQECLRKMSDALGSIGNGAYGYVLNAFNNHCSIDKLVAVLQDTVCLPVGTTTNTRAHNNGRSGCSQSSTTARPNVRSSPASNEIRPYHGHGHQVSSSSNLLRILVAASMQLGAAVGDSLGGPVGQAIGAGAGTAGSALAYTIYQLIKLFIKRL